MSRTKLNRKNEAFPIVREILQLKEFEDVHIFTKNELELFKSKLLLPGGPREASALTSCVYFIRNKWTNQEYKTFRSNSIDYQILLVPFDIMKKSLEYMMWIPKPIRCLDLDSCKKCGILSLHDVMKFELLLDHVKSKLKFFTKKKMANLVAQLKLDSGRAFDSFEPTWPTFLKG